MLFLTEHNASEVGIKKRFSAIEECTVLKIGTDTSYNGDHSVVICDVELNASSVLLINKLLGNNLRKNSISLLHLCSRPDATSLALAKQIEANVVLPRHASIEQIIFIVRRLVEAKRPAVNEPSPPATSIIRKSINQAAVFYSETLNDIRCGKTIDLSALERGCDAVIAAVGGQRMSVWLDMVRAYDDITYQHCLLVASFATLFASRLGLSVAKQRIISKAALLHDIGKLQIPLEILNKPGKLTLSEMEIVKSHPSVGHEMLLRQGGFDHNTLDMVRHHHEYIDGSGYPDKLSGEAVSSFVRIMTICDIYSALVERRSYKDPMPSLNALNILKNMGQKLDQNLVDSFHEMIYHS